MSHSKYASEGELFKKIMGKDWFRLESNIQKRFSEKTCPGQPLKYVGELTELKCSFWGKVLAHITQSFIPGALIPYNTQICPVDIEVYTKESCPNLYKQRIYKIPKKKPIKFTSYMIESESGEVLEYVGMGIGMKLLVFEKESNLHFKSDGYFIDIGRWRLSIPHFLSPGDVYLMHIDENENEFRISIEITHRWLGKMFTQKGVFRSVHA